jgi:peptidoglycan/xylan/chitin deacetylase (PgdA/CDA1 family)
MTLNDLKNKGTVSVMYHYVRDNDAEKTPHLSSLYFEDFKSQLDWLQSEFQLLTYAEMNDCIVKHKPFPANTFMLTFDDGLKDHYKYVFHELKKRKLEGIFYVNSSIYEKAFPMAVHITHFILEKIGAQEFTKIIVAKLKKHNVSIETTHLDDVYRYDDINYSHIKQLMNYSLNYAVRDKIIEELFFDFYQNPAEFCDHIYLSLDELKEMHEGGMIIGNHTHSHKVLSRLSREEQHHEIKKCSDFLKKELNIDNASFCFPYGHHHTFNGITLELLSNLNLSSAFTTKRETTSANVYGRFMLQRFDTVDLLKFHPNSRAKV